MNQSIPFSMLLGVAAIAGIAGTAQAQCVNNEGTFSLQRSAPPSDETFTTSGPVDADSPFKFELELGGDLDLFSTDTADAADEDAAMTSEAEASTDDLDSPTSETPAAGGERPTMFSLDADSSSAADLETVELGTPSLMSREEYLDSQAREINNCF